MESAAVLLQSKRRGNNFCHFRHRTLKAVPKPEVKKSCDRGRIVAVTYHKFARHLLVSEQAARKALELENAFSQLKTNHGGKSLGL